MGINQIKKIIKIYKEKSISDYANQKLAIDISIFMYQFKHSGYLLRNFEKQINTFKNYKIQPFYVFDGTPPIEKTYVLDKRRSNVNKIKITKQDFEDVKNLLKLHGLSYYDLKDEVAEAENFCSHLNRLNIVSGVISDDSDCFVFNAKKVLINFKTGSGLIKEYDLDENLENLEITHKQFIDICILCGTDYNTKGLAQIGPMKALKLIKEYKTIENIVSKKLKKIPEDFNYVHVRNLLNHKEYDIKNLNKYLVVNNNENKEELEKFIKKFKS